MNPYLEIEVTPLFSKDGMRSQGQSVRIVDEEKPTQWNEIGVVSPSYLLVHNTKVKGVVDQIADRSNLAGWQPRKQFFDGRRFVYAITNENLNAEVTPGDVVRFGLIAYNSYDGSRALSVGAYSEHLICSNGMTSEMYFSRFNFRHHQGNINWDEQTEQAFAALLPNSRGKLIQFATTLRRLRSKHITIPDLKSLRQEYLSDLSVSLWGKVLDRFLAHEANNGFGLLDACTNTFWHNEKQSFSDYRNNSYTTDALVKFSERLN